MPAIRELVPVVTGHSGEVAAAPTIRVSTQRATIQRVQSGDPL
jgi:hypothetical protein